MNSRITRHDPRLYVDCYHHKREVEKMPGNKAMTAVARKALKLIWGLYQSKEKFDRARVFTCASQFAIAAKSRREEELNQTQAASCPARR